MPFVFSGFYAFLEIFQKPPDGDEHPPGDSGLSVQKSRFLRGTTWWLVRAARRRKLSVQFSGFLMNGLAMMNTRQRLAVMLGPPSDSYEIKGKLERLAPGGVKRVAFLELWFGMTSPELWLGLASASVNVRVVAHTDGCS
ncbi:hypothetical protein DEO72_LG4g1286 [Vigna unguiculata]|uniref:Uncharacterized protein n=1 Tax=Vigna unguiculata TaxID=3917 RepID=A0A4D6LP78_VIGUN|nr:hypothetical protein DEO72_LG4g1286 [Vigna unguiculata]